MARIMVSLLSLTLTMVYGHTPSKLVEALAEQKSLAKYGTYGKDFQYYLKDGIDHVINEKDGVKLTKWYGRHNKTVDIIIAQPYITKIELPVNTSYPDKTFWLRDDMSYVVISGNATFGNESIIYGYGDVFWVETGWPHGVLRNVGSTPLVILAVGMDWVPQYGEMPSWYNPSVNWESIQYRSYRRLEGNWSENPSPHTDTCMTNGGVQNMNFDAAGNTPAVLRVKWAPNCSIPFHYHPTGAMYFILYGNMFYKGDFSDGDRQFGAGDSRWVRPGFAYGPEYNGDAPMEITVFGTDTPPMFDAPPSGPYKVQKTIEVSHVYDHQPGIVPHMEM